MRGREARVISTAQVKGGLAVVNSSNKTLLPPAVNDMLHAVFASASYIESEVLFEYRGILGSGTSTINYIRIS